MSPFVDIIIVNWNASNQLRECLDSIANSKQSEFKLNAVVIVDNASTDFSLDNLDDINLPMKIIRNTENKGFGFACNQGSSGSEADYILFLNPDTRLFESSIATAVSFIEKKKQQKVGVVGIQLVDDQGTIQRCCARFPKPINFWFSIFGIDKVIKSKSTNYLMTEWSHDTTEQVDHVMGAFYLIRREIFNSLKGFDEIFFVYFEDLDLSYRLKKLGWSSYYLAETQSFHKGGGTSENVKSTRIFYSIRSKILYGYKHFGFIQASALMIASILIEPFTRILFSVIRISIPQAQETVSGYAKLFSNYQEIYESIKVIRSSQQNEVD
jgi:N-acetylglucosaminyl-diphospho-decaprenol L-rhamnosyltransferase